MALREILTHQGACAGVYFPDLSSPFADLDDKTNLDSLKRPHGIDLNEDCDRSWCLFPACGASPVCDNAASQFSVI